MNDNTLNSLERARRERQRIEKQLEEEKEKLEAAKKDSKPFEERAEFTPEINKLREYYDIAMKEKQYAQAAELELRIEKLKRREAKRGQKAAIERQEKSVKALKQQRLKALLQEREEVLKTLEEYRQNFANRAYDLSQEMKQLSEYHAKAIRSKQFIQAYKIKQQMERTREMMKHAATLRMKYHYLKEAKMKQAKMEQSRKRLEKRIKQIEKSGKRLGLLDKIKLFALKKTLAAVKSEYKARGRQSKLLEKDIKKLGGKDALDKLHGLKSKEVSLQTLDRQQEQQRQNESRER
jgi:hypothetical protein